MGFAPADNPQVMVYVVIDTPNLPGKEQAHSSFATQVVQKILTDSLPYLNVFPTTDIETVPEELQNQLPEEDGIVNEETEGSTEPETEAKVYETDEYIVGEEESEAELPGSPAGIEEVETLPEPSEGTEETSEEETLSETVKEKSEKPSESSPPESSSSQNAQE